MSFDTGTSNVISLTERLRKANPNRYRTGDPKSIIQTMMHHRDACTTDETKDLVREQVRVRIRRLSGG